MAASEKRKRITSAGKAKRDTPKTKVCITMDGREHKVIGEDGKYLYCDGTQFTHTSRYIKRVEWR